MFFAIRRLIWTLIPPPFNPSRRDLVLMERAGAALDHYHDGTRPTLKGIRLASRILESHSLPNHALRSMVRERDADLQTNSARVWSEVGAERAGR